MNELKNQTAVPLPKGDGLRSETANLNSLLGMLNNPEITGAVVPPEAKEAVRVPTHPNVRKVPAEAKTTSPDTPAPIAAPRAARSPITRLFFTGGIGVGKDYVAAASGAQVIGFADPLYSLVGVLFPGVEVTATSGKDIPGVRELLQALGQWGRNIIDPKYPLTPARAMMTAFIKQMARANVFDPALCVEWVTFGSNPDIWLDSLVERANRLDAGRRVAATNVRFENEFKRLNSEGWTHYHVMCSPATRQDRLRKMNIQPGSPALVDTSERLAMALDADVMKKLRSPANTNRLRVVWNDTAPPPSPRVYTVNQWLQEIAIGETPLPEETPTMSQE